MGRNLEMGASLLRPQKRGLVHGKCARVRGPGGQPLTGLKKSRASVSQHRIK